MTVFVFYSIYYRYKLSFGIKCAFLNLFTGEFVFVGHMVACYGKLDLLLIDVNAG